MSETWLFDCHGNLDISMKEEKWVNKEEYSRNTEIVKYNRLNDSLLLFAYFEFEQAPESGHIVLTIEDITQKTIHWESAPFEYFPVKNGRRKVLMQRRIQMPPTSDKLKLFIWNPEKQEIKGVKDSVNMVMF